MSESMNNEPNDAAPLRSHEAEAMDRWLDAGLGEALGGERAPDVTAQVLARAAAGERPTLEQDDAVVGAGPWRQLWLAALLLLGLGVVVGVAWLQRAGAGRGDPAQLVATPSMQDPGESRILSVHSRQQIASLSPDLRAASAFLGKRGMEELFARCPKLEVLHLNGLRLGAQNDEGDDEYTNPIDLMHHVGRLTELVELHLDHVLDADVALSALRDLPKLRALSWVGSGIRASGVEAIASLRELQSLCIVTTLGSTSWSAAPLAALHKLREFKIRRGASSSVFESDADDESVQPWPLLQRLSLADGLVSARIGAKLLANTPALTDLDLGRASNIDLDTIRDLLRLPQLKRLRIGGSSWSSRRDFPGFGPELVPLLAAAEPLREVDLGVAPWFTLEHAATLLAAGKRVRVERDDAAFQQKLAELHRQHTYRQIHSVADVKALTPMVTHVQVRNHGDRVALALRECPWLEVVEFVRNDDDPLTATGLDAVLALPALRGLHVVGVDDLPADALRSLAKCTTLRELTLTGCAVDDAVLAALPSLPELRELELLAVRGFGDVGMRGIAGCRRLTSLTLSSCKHLTTEQLALVGEVRTLRRLALADLPNLRDRAVMPLQHLFALCDLDLARGPFTSMALQALVDLPMLRRLVLTDCTGLVGSSLLHVPTCVQELDLAGCPLGAGVATLLRDRFPRLRTLRLWNADWLDDDGFRALLAAPSLERLTAGDCTKMTPVHADAIRAAKRLRFLDITRSTCARDEDLTGVAADRPDLQIVRKVW